MKRTTILRTDDIAALLEMERKRRDMSTAGIVREALTAYLKGDSKRQKKLPFVGLGRSGQRDTARRAEEILSREWVDDRGRCHRPRHHARPAPFRGN